MRKPAAKRLALPLNPRVSEIHGDVKSTNRGGDMLHDVSLALVLFLPAPIRRSGVLNRLAFTAAAHVNAGRAGML